MKKILSFFAIMAMSSQLAFAHGGGHGMPPISEKEAIQYASEGIVLLIEDNTEIEGSKLDSSWKNVPENNKTISKKGSSYYIVNFKDAQNKNLYVLVSDQGEIYDANFSGTFEGLEQ